MTEPDQPATQNAPAFPTGDDDYDRRLAPLVLLGVLTVLAIIVLTAAVWIPR